jgi:hypothetical protein
MIKLEPSALRYDYDGYGYSGYADDGSGSHWKTIGQPHAEFLYTKDDILDFLEALAFHYSVAANTSYQVGERSYNLHASTALCEIADALRGTNEHL